jgi:hypothetical protein
MRRSVRGLLLRPPSAVALLGLRTSFPAASTPCKPLILCNQEGSWVSHLLNKASFVKRRLCFPLVLLCSKTKRSSPRAALEPRARRPHLSFAFPFRRDRFDENSSQFAEAVPFDVLTNHEESQMRLELLFDPRKIRCPPIGLVQEVATLLPFRCIQKAQREECIRPVRESASLRILHLVPEGGFIVLMVKIGIRKSFVCERVSWSWVFTAAQQVQFQSGFI